ncbi:putative glycoside hydrolase [Pendulispora albinea]|uniref:Glycoside hydrolase n=1 Tax=Pendulispora albinea TaxID=2741071 RepID=A0ABZ2LSX3_9BACT
MRLHAVAHFSLLSALFLSSTGYALPGRALAEHTHPTAPASAAPASPAPAPASVVAAAPDARPAAAVQTPREALVSWLKPRIPAGGTLIDRVDAPVAVAHVARQGETVESVADAYLDLTDVYLRSDLVAAIVRENALGRALLAKGPLAKGTRIVIPRIVSAPRETIEGARLPAAKPGEPMRGLYMRGQTAGTANYTRILDRMAQHGLNALVLDTKDYDGWLTYPSQVPLAKEAGAIKSPPIADLRRTIRFAHDRGIRVIMRVSCFDDELMAKARPRLSVQSKAGRAYPIGWLDPSNEEAQGYILALVEEALQAGADEIQLDYMRYPVLGIKNANFKLAERNLTQTVVIRDFVRRVHHVTQSRGVPLSLDIFGVVAFGHRSDIEGLGQDPAMLATECEALSPMVYPSHYAKGFNGWDEPGDHPEIVGMGTKAIRELIASQGIKGGAVIRPWLQAMHYKSPSFSPRYLAEEMRTGESAGASGWLMWNPGQDYGYTWAVASRQEKRGPTARKP